MEILSPSLPNNFFQRPQFASFITKNPLKAANFLYKTKNQLNPDILNIITQCFNQLPHKSNKMKNLWILQSQIVKIAIKLESF